MGFSNQFSAFDYGVATSILIATAELVKLPRMGVCNHSAAQVSQPWKSLKRLVGQTPR